MMPVHTFYIRNTAENSEKTLSATLRTSSWDHKLQNVQ